MQTADKIERRPRYLMLGMAVLVIVVAVAAVVLLRSGPTGQATDESSLPDQLGTRVVEILERAGLSESGGYGEYTDAGHPLEQPAAEIVCAARAFGFDPPEATTPAQVEVVYAHHMCAVVEPGIGWPAAIRASGPVAVDLTHPITISVPEQALPGEPDASYTDRIRALIPARYHQPALASDGFVDPAVVDELRARFEGS